MSGELGFVVDEFVGVLEYVNDDGVMVKEEVKLEMGDYGCVYDVLYQMLIVGMFNYVKEFEVFINLEIFECVFEQVMFVMIIFVKQFLQIFLCLFIFFEQRS